MDWLRMQVVALPRMKSQAQELWEEAEELNLIFSAILRTARRERE